MADELITYEPLPVPEGLMTLDDWKHYNELERAHRAVFFATVGRGTPDRPILLPEVARGLGDELLMGLDHAHDQSGQCIKARFGPCAYISDPAPDLTDREVVEKWLRT